MDRAHLIDTALTIAFAAFFSACRTFADNRDTNVKGWEKAQLVFANAILGVAVGLIVVPVSDAIHSIIPNPDARDRSIRLLMAAYFGWEGLPATMRALKKELKDQLEGRSHHAPERPEGTQPLNLPDPDGSPGPDRAQKDP